MARDPVQVMEWVIAQESSVLQSNSDDEVYLDALAIAETEKQRTRLDDRLEAARGSSVRVDLPGESLHGTLVDVGDELLLLESEEACVAIARASVISFGRLPRALRAEGANSRHVPITWAAVLREWGERRSVRFTLVDDRQVRGTVDSVGGDHVDIRADDGRSAVLVFTAIRSAVIVGEHFVAPERMS